MDEFKYSAIVDWAKKCIEDEKLPAGARFYSEKELCDIHGVSRQTVRQALMVLENQNVIVRKRGSGSFVRSAAENNSCKSMNVGVVSTYFSDYIFPSIVTGIERVLKSNSVGMQLSITHNCVSEEAQALKAMMAQNISGLIVEPSKSALPNPNMRLYDEIRSMNIPVVFFNAKYPWSDFPCVAMDDVAAGKIATDYLFDNGHRKIAGIFDLDDMQGHNRYRGFMESCINHGIYTAEQNVMWFSTNEKNTLFSLSEDRINALLKGCTAVVCYNDSLAINLLNFCKNIGINVPNDLSVTSIDNSKLASVCDVPLTTVAHPHQLLGEMAAEKMIEEISGRKTGNENVVFTPELVVRQSVIHIK